MPKVIYPNSQSYKGPWMIDQVALNQLDEITTNAWKLMTDAKEKDIEEETKEEVKSLGKKISNEERQEINNRIHEHLRYKTESKSVKLSTLSSKTIEAESIKEVLNGAAVKEETICNLKLSYTCANYSFEISFGEFDADSLRFRVTPAETSLGEQIFSTLERWAVALKPPVWWRIWREMAGSHWLIMLFVFMMGTFIMPSSSKAYQKKLNIEANTLLDNGINNSNLTQAVSLLLAKEFEYFPETYNVHNYTFLKKFLTTIGIGFIFCLCLSFPPPKRILLGIGKDEQRILYTRRWIKFVSVSIPTLVFSSILVPFIINILMKIYAS